MRNDVLRNEPHPLVAQHIAYREELRAARGIRNALIVSAALWGAIGWLIYASSRVWGG